MSATTGMRGGIQNNGPVHSVHPGWTPPGPHPPANFIQHAPHATISRFLDQFSILYCLHHIKVFGFSPVWTGVTVGGTLRRCDAAGLAGNKCPVHSGIQVRPTLLHQGQHRVPVLRSTATRSWGRLQVATEHSLTLSCLHHQTECAEMRETVRRECCGSDQLWQCMLGNLGSARPADTVTNWR